MFLRQGSNRRIGISILIYLLWVAVFVYFTVTEEKAELYSSLDKQLKVAALATPLMLPSNLHHKGMKSSDITAVQYNKNLLRLSEYTDNSDLSYIYTLILRDEKVLFTSSSATLGERRTGENLTIFFQHYDDADPRLYDVFKKGEPTFLEYTDKWGTFRSIFLPLRAKDGTLFVSAADLPSDYIHDEIMFRVYQTLLVAALFLLFSLPILWAFIKRLRNREALELMAYYDVLTKLPNRTLFMDRFHQALAHSNRTKSILAVCFLDLDMFKPVNDSYGHGVGDRLLEMAAERITSNIREEDTVSRQGGDEFAILLGDLGSSAECERMLRRIHDSLAVPYFIGDHTIHISASSGVTLCPQDGFDIEVLLRHADEAMYKAKESGGSRYIMYEAS